MSENIWKPTKAILQIIEKKWDDLRHSAQAIKMALNDPCEACCKSTVFLQELDIVTLNRIISIHEGPLADEINWFGKSCIVCPYAHDGKKIPYVNIECVSATCGLKGSEFDKIQQIAKDLFKAMNDMHGKLFQQLKNLEREESKDE